MTAYYPATSALVRLLVTLDQHNPTCGPGMSPAAAMAIVTGRRAPADRADAMCAAYLLAIATRQPAASADLAELLDAHDEAEALRLKTALGQVLAFDAFDRALDDFVRNRAPEAQIDAAMTLHRAYADYGTDLKVYALAQLAHACALVGLDANLFDTWDAP